MRYPGSKRRIAKEIIVKIFERCSPIELWIEPFVGGANLIDKVPNTVNRMGFDINNYLIELLKIIRDVPSILPKNKYELTKEKYYNIKNNKDAYSEWLVGFAGIYCSFGGKWFTAYANNKCDVDYVNRGFRMAQRQSINLKNIYFECKNYKNIKLERLTDSPERTVIYCDIPYYGTRKDNYIKNDFNHNEFLNWCIEVHKKGFNVFISEYRELPKPFELIWTKAIRMIISSNDNRRMSVEKLYTLN